ncbi:MAG: peptidyl-alpha-hydroxyglycine alpha-amidating lyase family protein [Planctomycetaceae bacterium]
MSRHLLLLAMIAGLQAGLVSGSAKAQNAVADRVEKKAVEDELPPYPRINPTPWYEVDPGWPKKPAEFVWEAMPGIAVDADDNVWTFTRSSPPIQVYRPDGSLLKSWGDDTIETAHHIKIDDDGNIWIADIGKHIIRRFTPDGTVLQTIGTEGVAGEDETHLNQPTDMAFASNGDIYVSDGYGNNRVVHFDAEGNFVKAWGKLGVGPLEFSLPHAIAIDSTDRVYVADRNNARVQVFNLDGRLLDSWTNVVVPWGFWVTDSDDIWVCGCSPMPWRDDPDYPGAPLSCPPKDQVLMSFHPSGRLQQLWTVPKGTDGAEQPGDVNWVHAIALDSKGNIYLGDIIGKRAQKFVLRK